MRENLPISLSLSLFFLSTVFFFYAHSGRSVPFTHRRISPFPSGRGRSTLILWFFFGNDAMVVRLGLRLEWLSHSNFLSLSLLYSRLLLERHTKIFFHHGCPPCIPCNNDIVLLLIDRVARYLRLLLVITRSQNPSHSAMMKLLDVAFKRLPRDYGRNADYRF